MSNETIDGISFSITPKGQFIIPTHILDKLNQYKQTKSGNREAGGILLGRQFEDTDDIIVDEISSPQFTDVRKRNSFYRSEKHHNIAVKRWKQSNGCCLYLGLWHTHPEPKPTPSVTDYHDWKNALTNGEFEGNNLFFIIIGTTNICCWQGYRASRLKRMFRAKNNFVKLSQTNE